MILPPDRQPKTDEIIAAQKIIADISSGLYRSPAAALKELVSNAYDADATNVTITTDAPQFRSLVVHDDGNGMSIERFLEVLKHIGGSRKRIEGKDVTERGRKIIGRIGIGMLAVAQLGYRFHVSSSQAGSSTRFIAEIDLEPFHKDDAALVSMGRLRNDDTVRIGAIRYVDEIPEDKSAHYTVITVPNVRQGLISEITRDVRSAVGADEKLSVHQELIGDFGKVIETIRAVRRVDTELDGYYYMLWELAQLCPINYSDRGPFDSSEREIEGVEQIELPHIHDFSVLVDGIELKRPQLFPSRRAISYQGFTPKVYPIQFDRIVSGRHLRFGGYIYVQKPKVEPEEYNGVHVRIRHVGIGKYDRTWLGYPFDEGIKFGQITGEVFVEDGLEQALNIDRDSFRETDVHYQALRAFLWDKLRKDVFPDFKRRQKEFSKEKKNLQLNELESRLDEALALLPTPVDIQSVNFNVDVQSPTISNWIEFDGESLKFERNRWRGFITTCGLTSQDSQDRFIRVLKVLMSNEITSGMPQDEIEPFLQALAIAVR